MNKTTTKASTYMPVDVDTKKILRERAETYALQKGVIDEVETGVLYIKFTLGNNEIYGIEYRSADAVVKQANLKKPPCVSSDICGILNYQGKLIGVIDLEKILNIKPANEGNEDPHALSNIIIVTNSKIILGIKVGEISMSDTYKKELLSDALLSEADIERGYVKGVDKGKISIIDIDKLLSAIKITEGAVL